MPKPALKRNDLAESAVWTIVLERYDELRKVAINMARVDHRLDAEDLFHSALEDIVSARHQWDTKRAFKPWAVTRIWKARTYALRDLNRLDRFHSALGARAHAVLTEDGWMDPMDQARLDEGMWGTADRTEALALLEQLLDLAEPEVAIMLRCVLDGRRSRKLPNLTPEQLTERLANEMGLRPLGGTDAGGDRGCGPVQCVLPLARHRGSRGHHQQGARG